mgnify:CR=1 FL=1
MTAVLWLLMAWFAGATVLCALFSVMKRHERDPFADEWEEWV